MDHGHTAYFNSKSLLQMDDNARENPFQHTNDDWRNKILFFEWKLNIIKKKKKLSKRYKYEIHF